MIIWYNQIAKLYDFFTEKFYKKPRFNLINSLNIQAKSRILIVACGTGQSFNLIENKIGKYGEIIAIDFSSGMLKQAEKRIEKNGWKNIKLIQKDIRKVNKKFFQKENIDNNFDIIIGELAFTVIPDWQKVLKISIDLLNENGKLGLLDWYRKKNDIITKTVNYLAKAETTRNTIDIAKLYTKDFKIIEKYFFNSIYIAIGNKQIGDT